MNNKSLHDITQRVSDEIKNKIEDIKESKEVFEARAMLRWLRRWSPLAYCMTVS